MEDRITNESHEPTRGDETSEAQTRRQNANAKARRLLSQLFSLPLPISPDPEDETEEEEEASDREGQTPSNVTDSGFLPPEHPIFSEGSYIGSLHEWREFTRTRASGTGGTSRRRTQTATGERSRRKER